MASYRWPDGSKGHSIPWEQHQKNTGAWSSYAPKNQAALGQSLISSVTPQGPLGPPPVGTYDPSIDYNANASKTGLGDLTNDSQTAFEHGQQDYKRGTEQIGLNTSRENENYGISTADLVHQFGILGHQQADQAAQRGITSAGLLGKSADIRAANQAHDQAAIDLGHGRTLADLLDSQKTLDINNARQFGGFNGQQIINPLTGQPEMGSLLTTLTRGIRDNSAFQAGSDAQRIAGAQAGGYIAPPTIFGSKDPATVAAWKQFTGLAKKPTAPSKVWH